MESLHNLPWQGLTERPGDKSLPGTRQVPPEAFARQAVHVRVLWVGGFATDTPTPGPGGPWRDVLTLGSDRAGALAVPGPGAAGASFGATHMPFLPR